MAFSQVPHAAPHGCRVKSPRIFLIGRGLNFLTAKAVVPGDFHL